jgi:hypothetical protein
MTNDATDSELLAREDCSIQLLARETLTEIEKVRTMYLIEYKKLAANAHITTFLPLLACTWVWQILEAPRGWDNAQTPSPDAA